MAAQHVLRKQHQLPVRVNDVPVLGDHAEPVAVAVEGQAEFGVGLLQAADQVLQVFRMGRVRMVFGKRPATSQNSSITSQPSARYKSPANAPATPLPQSMAIFIGRASLTSDVMRSRYCWRMSCVRKPPLPCAVSFLTM